MKAIARTSTRAGFSLIELLVAMAILAVMILFLMLGQGLSIGRSDDAARKSDFAKMKVAFEDYYNDKGCYPNPALMRNCGSSDLAPYMAKIPCEPRTRRPYAYYKDASCKWYGLFTTLADTKDPVSATLGCSPNCGVTGYDFNYVQTNGSKPLTLLIPIVNGDPSGWGSGGPGGGGTPTPTPGASSTPSPSPTPSATPHIGRFACDPNGLCNAYDDPIGKGCPITFDDPEVCQAACANQANRCMQ